nr:putative reverse transcriptase domain-containing protein [Tanacetum cinerariifolium]
MPAAAIQKLVVDKVVKALDDDRAARENVDSSGGNADESGGQGGALHARECLFSRYMKCNPTTFYGKEGEIKLCHWFEETKSRALTWWNSQVTKLGIDVANRKPWTEVKKMTTEEFYPDEEIQRMENELWNLKFTDTDIVAYTQRFNELVLLCPDVVPCEKKKVEAYIKGLLENIKGETTSSKPVILNDVVQMAHTLMEQKVQAKAKIVAKGNKRKEVQPQTVTAVDCVILEIFRPSALSVENLAIKQEIAEEKEWLLVQTLNQLEHVMSVETKIIIEASAQIKTTSEVEMLLEECMQSEMPSRDKGQTFSHLIDIKPVRLSTSYEVELADGKIVSKNTVLRGCTLNLVNHLFEVDLMPIELGALDITIGMDWLVKHDVVIVCGKKVVHIPVKNKMSIVKGNSGVSRLKVISCIKAIKYIEMGCQLFLAQVTEKKPTERRLEEVPVIRDFPEVFPDDLSGLAPPQKSNLE